MLNVDDIYSLEELLSHKSLKLNAMYFEIVGTAEDDVRACFFNVHKKKYIKNGVERIMIQIVDVSQ